MVIEGIYTGIPKKEHKPVADGIVQGLPLKKHSAVGPHTMSVRGSSTQYAAGVFGAGATPQGVGDAAHSRSGGLMMAHNHPNAMKKGRLIAQEMHKAMHS
jgi:hypothetical protein